MLVNTFTNTALCQHVRFNNQPCGQPALRGRRFCRFHQSGHAKRPDYSLPMIEDAMSLQFGVMQVIRALHDRAVGHKTAALTLYGLQIASGNLKRFCEEWSQAGDSSHDEFLAEIVREMLQLPQEEFRDDLAQVVASSPATIEKSPASER